MKNSFAVISLALLFLVGCNAAPEKKEFVYTPVCEAARLPQDISENTIIRNLECGNKERAKEIAREGAERGDIRMANLYLTFLESNNDLAAGLVYALRGAEQGDGEATIWVMKIVRKYKIKTLVVPVSDMYERLINSKVSYADYLLDDYLNFSLGEVLSGVYLTVDYSNRFFEFCRPSLTVKQLADAQALLKEINAKSTVAGAKSQN